MTDNVCLLGSSLRWGRCKRMFLESNLQHCRMMGNLICSLHGMKLFLASELIQNMIPEGIQLFQRKMELQTAPILGIECNSLALSSSGHSCSTSYRSHRGESNGFYYYAT